MLVAPSDHVIPDLSGFKPPLEQQHLLPKPVSLVTFGIRPDRPETGYGWLELSQPTPDFAPEPQPLKELCRKA